MSYGRCLCVFVFGGFVCLFVFFFKQKTAYEMRISDWSSDVCSSDLRFGYDDGRAILKGITIDIPAGHTVAVVGPSGAGKSTLARLMYRFYDLTGGRITIDGQDIAQVTQASLRAAVGIVPQDTVLVKDRKRAVWGKSGAERVALGGG